MYILGEGITSVNNSGNGPSAGLGGDISMGLEATESESLPEGEVPPPLMPMRSYSSSESEGEDEYFDAEEQDENLGSTEDLEW